MFFCISFVHKCARHTNNDSIAAMAHIRHKILLCDGSLQNGNESHTFCTSISEWECYSHHRWYSFVILLKCALVVTPLSLIMSRSVWLQICTKTPKNDSNSVSLIIDWIWSISAMSNSNGFAPFQFRGGTWRHSAFDCLRDPIRAFVQCIELLNLSRIHCTVYGFVSVLSFVSFDGKL